MAYQALYRKYRPASFDDVVGQKHIVTTLKNAIASNRIAHAYLFCGPRGTGKTSIAKIFARTLNCTGNNPPCLECENCKLSLSGSHPDIIEIDAASNNGVDEVRALIDRVAYAPLEGRYKVYIIDEVHMMTSGAFNALLKTIEEPPAHVIFIFATTEPHKVLPTILSRCQRYDFSKVSHSDIEKRLFQICEAEKVNADTEALSLIADLADGGMRDALSILDQCIAYEQSHLTVDSVREIYGVVRPEEIGHLVENLTPQNAETAIQFLNEIESRGIDMKRFTADLISMFKDSLLLDMSNTTTLISDQRKRVLKQSFLGHPVQKRIQILNDLMNLYNKLAFSSNVMDYIETILLKAALWQEKVIYQAPYEKKKPVQNRYEMKSETKTEFRGHPADLPKVNKKTDLASLFWNSDVSRETMNPAQKPESEFTFSEDFLLSLLVGATKSEKSRDQNHMTDLDHWLSDLTLARFAAALHNVQIAASGSTYILVAAPGELEKNNINELQTAAGFEQFTNSVLEKPKKVFALTISETRKLIEAFKKRSKENSLPAAAQIEAVLPAVEKEVPVEEELKSRFADLEIIDD